MMLFPKNVNELSTDILTAVMQPLQPGIEITAFEMPELAQCGDGKASTADRIILKLKYAGIVPENMPGQVMLKTMLVSPHAPMEMYENEVRFYRDIRPGLTLETPRVFASDFDKKSGQFGIIMEDLSLRQVCFPNATYDVSVEQIKSVLRTLAKLHGHFWQSPRLETDLNWIATPLKGGMSDIFQQVGFLVVEDQVKKNPFKQILIAPLGLSLQEMHQCMSTFQHEVLQQPQTLLHGDTHIANTYFVNDGEGGLYDWQLMVRGNWAHDVSYVMVTGLSTELRRKHEKELLSYYLDLLQAQNINNIPTIDEARYLYRKSIMWGLFIGWLITPPTNYGETITSANIRKLVNAACDLDSFSFTAS